MQAALQLHHEILRSAIEYHGGVVFQIVGDAFCAAFPEAPSAVAAAVQVQCALFETEWDLPVPIRVRMGIHTGLADPVDPGSVVGGYTSNQTLNRVSRIMSAAMAGRSCSRWPRRSFPGMHYLSNPVCRNWGSTICGM